MASMYYEFLGAACVAWFAITVSLASKEGLPPVRVALALLAVLAMFMLGMRLHSLVLEQGVPISAIVWRPALLFEAGHRLPGGALLALLTIPLAGRVLGLSLGRLLDAIAAACVVALGIGRVGCFIEGCCFGTLSNLPWAVSHRAGTEAFRNHSIRGLLEPAMASSLPVHPFALYIVVSCVALGMVVFLVWRRRAFPGEVMLVVLALGGLRSAWLEGFREIVAVPAVPLRQGFWLASGIAASLLWATLRLRWSAGSAEILAAQRSR